MRKIALSLTMFLAAILVVGLVFTSCKKDDFTEEDAINLLNNLETEDYIAEYTVLLVDAATNNEAVGYKSATAVESMEGAGITLTVGDLRITQIADSIGMVTFTNIPAGLAAVNIKKAGYSEVNFVVNLQHGPGLDGMPGGVKASNIIPMIPITGATTATLTGRITYESDLTNTSQEVANGVVVLASIVPGSSPTLTSVGSEAAFEKIYYGNLNMQDTTNAQGIYTITVPSTADGLQYSITVLDFEATQTLLMPTVNGEENPGVTVATTRFGSRLGTASDVVRGYPAYIVFPVPNAVRTDAAATASIDTDSPVESVNVTNSGNGYNITADAFYTYIAGPTLVTDYAIVEVNLDSDFKRVTDIGIEDGGADHSVSDAIFLNRMIVAYVSAVDPTTGEITGITDVTPWTTFFDGAESDDPVDADYQIPNHINANNDVLIISRSGNGAELEFTFANNGYDDSEGKYEFSVVGHTTIDGGDDYKVGDLICLPLNPTTLATAAINIEASTVTAVAVTNTGSGYVSGEVTVLLEGGGGQNATASATVVNGKITAINITNGGFGYTSAPTVVIINNVIPEQIPVIYVDNNVDGTLKASYFTLNAAGNYVAAAFPIGAGYATPVTLPITSSVSGVGTGATISPVLNGSGQVTSLVLSDPGADYEGINTPSSEVSCETASALVKGGGMVYRDIYLGTGVRIIEE